MWGEYCDHSMYWWLWRMSGSSVACLSLDLFKWIKLDYTFTSSRQTVNIERERGLIMTVMNLRRNICLFLCKVSNENEIPLPLWHGQGSACMKRIRPRTEPWGTQQSSGHCISKGNILCIVRQWQCVQWCDTIKHEYMMFNSIKCSGQCSGDLKVSGKYFFQHFLDRIGRLEMGL